MDASLIRVLVCLIAGIAVIVLLTAKFRVHAFFALIIACFLVGLGVKMPPAEVLNTVKDGFGNILKSLGVILEHTGCTKVMANAILNAVGKKRAPFAMSLTGLIVGLPIFCDSGYIVLSGLNKSIAGRTGISVIVMAVSLATGLYSVHCLIPPHPGAAAAAGTLDVDFGKLIVMGIVVAIPAMIAGYLWTNYVGAKLPKPDAEEEILVAEAAALPSALKAFMPVAIPILLIAIESFFAVAHTAANQWVNFLLWLGDPIIALSIGVLLAFNSVRGWKRTAVLLLLQEGVEKAGGVLVIIGAGGAFGAVLAATQIGSHLSGALPLAALGLFFPFLLTFVLKTAQGSSTVAIITGASIVLPLLTALGLNTDKGHLLCVLAMGAGSMMISHANDAYFWVIAKFSGLEMKTMLRVYSAATACMGLTSLAVIYILSYLL